MQLLELARENAELKDQLYRILREAERIQRLLVDGSTQTPWEREHLGEEIA